MTLDRLRRLAAAQRAREAVEDARYHEAQAASALARAALLARTWDLDPERDYVPAGESLDKPGS